MSETATPTGNRAILALLAAILLALIALVVVILVDPGDDKAAAEETAGDATATACRQFTVTEAEVNGLDDPVRAGNFSPTVLSTYETAGLELREVATVEGLDPEVFEALADLSTGITAARVTFAGYAEAMSYNGNHVTKRLLMLERLATAVETACEPHLP